MIEELALQRAKYKHLSNDEWRWMLQQVEGRERTADKLPTFAAMDDWWYPVRLSCEQCSSEETARYKASLVSGETMVDLTGGYGVDTYFLNDSFSSIEYIEQNAELCRIATHNFANKPITIHNSTAEEFLASAGQYDLIFLDPARRDSHGGKVFRLEDCTPNVVELLPTLLAHGKRLLLKLSPMLDLTQAVKELSAFSIQWSVFVVAIKNEVKEVLLLSHQPSEVGSQAITAIDLSRPEQVFVFTREEERDCLLESGECKLGEYLYEANAAILKAGAYKLAGKRFGLRKLDVNTHLYCSDTFVENFPGRVWEIKSEGVKDERMKELNQANVLCRNYPLTPEALKKKLHLKDGGTTYIVGCRVCGKPTLLWAERLS